MTKISDLLPAGNNALGGPSRLTLLRLARAEARDLSRRLRRSGLPATEVSAAVPALTRSIAEHDRLYARLRRVSLPVYSVIATMPCWFILSELTNAPAPIFLFFPANLFLRQPEGSEIALAVALYFAGLAVSYILFANWHWEKSSIAQVPLRIEQYLLTPEKRKPRKRALMLNKLTMIFVAAGMALFVVHLMITKEVSFDSFGFVATTVVVWWLWFATALSLVLAVLSTRMLNWSSPRTGLVRTLVDAYSTIESGGARGWRSMASRRKAAAHLGAAAAILEGPMLRAFAGAGNEAFVRPRFLAAAAELRAKVAWLATPMADTQGHLAREIGSAMLVAAAGDLHRLGHDKETVGGPSGARAGLAARTVAFGRWAVVALGPGAALGLTFWMASPQYKPSDTIIAIWIQFSALCFVVASISMVDPAAREKLGSVVSTGSALFGWGRSSSRQ